MSGFEYNLNPIFELEEIVKVFLKESKTNTNTPFQIDFDVNYRPSREEDMVRETVSVFLSKKMQKKQGILIVQLEEGVEKTGYINNISVNKDLGLQTISRHKWGANPTFKTRCFISQWILGSGLYHYRPIVKSYSVSINNIKSVGFVKLEPKLKEIA